jgi:hypothetical protein
MDEVALAGSVGGRIVGSENRDRRPLPGRSVDGVLRGVQTKFMLPAWRVRALAYLGIQAQLPTENYCRLFFKLSASSTSRRSASERDGLSGCLSAHASTLSLSAGERRIGIVSP